jgi:hypothetical protein
MGRRGEWGGVLDSWLDSWLELMPWLGLFRYNDGAWVLYF